MAFDFHTAIARLYRPDGSDPRANRQHRCRSESRVLPRTSCRSRGNSCTAIAAIPTRTNSNRLCAARRGRRSQRQRRGSCPDSACRAGEPGAGHARVSSSDRGRTSLVDSLDATSGRPWLRQTPIFRIRLLRLVSNRKWEPPETMPSPGDSRDGLPKRKAEIVRGSGGGFAKLHNGEALIFSQCGGQAPQILGRSIWPTRLGKSASTLLPNRCFAGSAQSISWGCSEFRR